ncbi:MAG TPA: DUF4239 domain-containing protein [Candidatus Baltobacteraceae bacterium]|jgi:hypothetical protein
MIFLVTAAVAVAVALAAAGVHYVVQRCIGPRILVEQNNVAGFIYSAIAVTYAVVLGFVVVVVWEKYGEVQNHVDAEAAAVFDLYHTAEAFPQPLRRRIRTDLRGYVADVVTREWPEMTDGTVALSAVSDVENIAREIETFTPSNRGQQDAHQIAMQELLRAFDARRERVLATRASVPPILWFGLIAGASATLCFTFFFGVQNRVMQLLMTGILAALITIMFVVIKEFDTPFRGPNAITPNVWLFYESRMKILENEA